MRPVAGSESLAAYTTSRTTSATNDDDPGDADKDRDENEQKQRGGRAHAPTIGRACTALDARAGCSAPLDQLDPIAVGILHETQARSALANGVRLALRLDPLLVELRQGLVGGADPHRAWAAA